MKLLNFLGFLIGFIITILIINYININNSKKIVEKYSTVADIKSITTIPSDTNKFIAIDSFNDKIDNKVNRWYDNNKINFFTYLKQIELVPNGINADIINGAKIDSIQLNGPNSYYFANNTETNELNEFSIYFAGKFKGTNYTNNILFELIGNTETINYPNEVKYSQSVVNLNFMKNQNNNFDIIITIGNVVYKGLINNIDKSSIINNDVINFYLIYNASQITFGINKQIYRYKIDENAFKVKLGSTPVIINKGGNLNLDLYLFVYYKTAISFTDIQQLSRFTYSNLSGLETAISNTPKCDVLTADNIFNEKLKEMEINILKSIEKKNLDLKIEPSIDIKPLSIKNIEDDKMKILNWFF